MRLINFLKKFRFSHERSLLTNCHSARSNAESQNLIVILRIMKRSPRIYSRTHNLWDSSTSQEIQIFLRTLFADPVILREAKPIRRIYWKTIELSFCAKQSEVAESLLYQNISTIHSKLYPLSSILSPIFKFSWVHSKSKNRFFFNWFSDINHKNCCSESFSWQNC